MPSKTPIIGVYKIDTNNEVLYVGSSKNVTRRFSEHKYRLNKKNHVNINLQSVVENLGIDNIKFTVLETTSLENLGIKEYNWMVKLKPTCNIMLIDPSGISRHTEERKNSMSINNPSKRPEVRIMRSNQLKKYNPARDSAEVRAKISKSQKIRLSS